MARLLQQTDGQQQSDDSSSEPDSSGSEEEAEEEEDEKEEDQDERGASVSEPSSPAESSEEGDDDQDLMADDGGCVADDEDQGGDGEDNLDEWFDEDDMTSQWDFEQGRYKFPWEVEEEREEKERREEEEMERTPPRRGREEFPTEGHRNPYCLPPDSWIPSSTDEELDDEKSPRNDSDYDSDESGKDMTTREFNRFLRRLNQPFTLRQVMRDEDDSGRDGSDYDSVEDNSENEDEFGWRDGFPYGLMVDDPVARKVEEDTRAFARQQGCMLVGPNGEEEDPNDPLPERFLSPFDRGLIVGPFGLSVASPPLARRSAAVSTTATQAASSASSSSASAAAPVVPPAPVEPPEAAEVEPPEPAVPPRPVVRRRPYPRGWLASPKKPVESDSDEDDSDEDESEKKKDSPPMMRKRLSGCIDQAQVSAAKRVKTAAGHS
ncbi:unnamed protein product [Vitrella brassicaformis CCMP3155]|uniref:Uncharacterized protein n=1 Tax=Vitrella brassicaformis (strain CCMP3155) TaxID=1169540 RepID=A0A0G4EQA1_VITBC|nr:unnamed protein product [Vitrella brassicaformis CCMP3155]|eukprot:CEL99626.1 unnamed protein product [Vitrella brassicaformis CCMP3155]